MNTAFFVSGLFSSFITVGHAYFGEALFFKGIADSSYPTTYWGDADMTKRLMKNAWHFLTVALFISAAAMFTLAFTSFFQNPLEIARLIAVMHLLFTLVFFYYGITRPFIIIRAPVWIGTAGTALFAWLGTV